MSMYVIYPADELVQSILADEYSVTSKRSLPSPIVPTLAYTDLPSNSNKSYSNEQEPAVTNTIVPAPQHNKSEENFQRRISIVVPLPRTPSSSTALSEAFPEPDIPPPLPPRTKKFKFPKKSASIKKSESEYLNKSNKNPHDPFTGIKTINLTSKLYTESSRRLHCSAFTTSTSTSTSSSPSVQLSSRKVVPTQPTVIIPSISFTSPTVISSNKELNEFSLISPHQSKIKKSIAPTTTTSINKILNWTTTRRDKVKPLEDCIENRNNSTTNSTKFKQSSAIVEVSGLNKPQVHLLSPQQQHQHQQSRESSINACSPSPSTSSSNKSNLPRFGRSKTVSPKPLRRFTFECIKEEAEEEERDDFLHFRNFHRQQSQRLIRPKTLIRRSNSSVENSDKKKLSTVEVVDVRKSFTPSPLSRRVVLTNKHLASVSSSVPNNKSDQMLKMASSNILNVLAGGGGGSGTSNSVGLSSSGLKDVLTTGSNSSGGISSSGVPGDSNSLKDLIHPSLNETLKSHNALQFKLVRIGKFFSNLFIQIQL